MKPLVKIVFVFALALVVVACGSDEAAQPAANDAAPAPDATPAPAAVDGPAEAPASEPTSAVGTSPLLDPDHPDANRQAPSQFRAVFTTTKGEFVVEVHRDWAPLGADRFYSLVRTGYYDGNTVFRVVDGFVAQFGMHGDPAINEAWDMASISDDPMGEMNTRGRLTFAHGGPNTRTTQLFINLGDNLNLDNMGFPPFGEVIDGMDVIDSFYTGYGDGPPYGSGPDQGRIGAEGTAYFDREYPLLDRIVSTRIVSER
jgi:peptidyl-prolyl cis-trans isomerase A (cyclophilin A)